MNWKPISPIPQAFGPMSAQQAASKCGYDRPTLYAHPDRFGYAEEVAAELRYNCVPEPLLARDEWFVEWNGERYGSDLETDRPNPNMRVQEELPL